MKVILRHTSKNGSLNVKVLVLSGWDIQQVVCLVGTFVWSWDGHKSSIAHILFRAKDGMDSAVLLAQSEEVIGLVTGMLVVRSLLNVFVG